jgi:HD-GYP domain-containing protein (c-di-GMP phosphodiesterase class II)
LARSLAEELGLPNAVLDSVGSSYERWDGKGWPGDLAGHDIPLASRITQLAEFVEVAHRTGGIEAARAVAERRAGKQFDPRLVAVLVADAEKLFYGIDELGSWDAVIDSEPALTAVLSPQECDAALEAIARFVDLKSPYRLGHSQAVAELAADAGRHLGVPAEEVRVLHRAALVTSYGNLGVSNAIWDRERLGARPAGSAPHRPDAAPVGITGRPRSYRRAASRATRRIRIPARPHRAGDHPCGSHPRRRRCVPVDARVAPVPRRENRRRGRPGVAR